MVTGRYFWPLLQLCLALSLFKLEKVLYLLQAAAYPFTWLARWLDGFSAETIIFIALAITILLT